MKPKRLFQVYREEKHTPVESVESKTGKLIAGRGLFAGYGKWRWRTIAPRNGQIVGGSQEAFDSKSNALRAARREASLYPEGVAAVEVTK